MATGSGFQSKKFDLKKKFTSAGDTSMINRYTRLALKMAEKKPDLDYIKPKLIQLS